MKLAEQAASLFWVALAVAVCFGATGFVIGTPSEPGPGFLPFWTAALMGVLAIANFLIVTTASPGPRKAHGAGETRRGRALIVAVAILAYALLLPRLGYLLATLLGMTILFSVYGGKRWWHVLALSICVVLVTYVVFHVLLKVQFPVGILG
jgi:hypothetical protein